MNTGGGNHKLKHSNTDVSELFKDGMGVDDLQKNEVGARVPKLGLRGDMSQKSFNQKRDRSMKSGTFKLFYEPHEVIEPSSSGIRMVDKSMMPAYVKNMNENLNFTDRSQFFNIQEGKKQFEFEKKEDIIRPNKKANVSNKN